MDRSREDATSLHGGASENTSEAAGVVNTVDSMLVDAERSKIGDSNGSSESGLEADRSSVGRGSGGGSYGERELEPAEMVRLKV